MVEVEGCPRFQFPSPLELRHPPQSQPSKAWQAKQFQQLQKCRWKHLRLQCVTDWRMHEKGRFVSLSYFFISFPGPLCFPLRGLALTLKIPLQYRWPWVSYYLKLVWVLCRSNSFALIFSFSKLVTLQFPSFLHWSLRKASKSPASQRSTHGTFEQGSKAARLRRLRKLGFNLSICLFKSCQNCSKFSFKPKNLNFFGLLPQGWGSPALQGCLAPPLEHHAWHATRCFKGALVKWSSGPLLMSQAKSVTVTQI